MNNYLINAKIWGLWGSKSALELPLDLKFNFIIGKNGTGKTTVINLIAAVLTADFERLDKIVFSKIILTLRKKNGRHRPSIEVTKTQKKHVPYFDITYRIRQAANEAPQVFDLDALEEERIYRGMPPRMLRDRFYRDKFIYIQRQLDELVQVSWLSVHRHTEERASSEDRKSTTAVDQKLVAMNNSLVRYFSKITTAFSEETRDFQKNSFLSLISIQKEANLRNFVDSIQIEEENSSLASILELLGVEQKSYIKQLDQIRQQFNAAKDPFLSNSGLTLQQLFALISSYKAHGLVQLYEELQNTREQIYQPIHRFLSVINGLFHPRKSVSISEQHELVIKNNHEKKIELEDLSSGEKQLLIILGQALLQGSVPVVYIADEPELSLHVEWQEKLTSSITQLNPNAQIIFATHSPDIVATHTDKTIDMETLFS